MSQSQIRLARTPDIDKVLVYLRHKYSLLSEAEIIKVALSEKYYNEMQEVLEREQQIRNAYNHLMAEGRKVGIKLMKEKGLDPNKVTEKQFYDLFLNTHRHKD